VARHQRAAGKGVKVLVLDHYLEILARKPGALPGATALAQARAAGTFTPAHEAFWAAARKALGDGPGTRALVEVLLLHRHLGHGDVHAGLTAALAVGSVSPDVIAVEARKAAAPRPAATASAGPTGQTPGHQPHRAAPDRAARRRPAAALDCCLRRSARQGQLMTTRRGVTEQAAIAAIDSATRVLRLPTIRGRFEEIAAAAQREQLTYLGFLAELVMAECDDRDHRRAVRRIHDAGFPRDKRIDDFDFDANPSVSPAVIHQLSTCAWVKAGHPLCPIGDSGTGKSHLLIGPGNRSSRNRLPGPLHPGVQAGQRACRSRRRQAAIPHHRPLRPRRPALPR
jgi:hypothetical protein